MFVELTTGIAAVAAAFVAGRMSRRTEYERSFCQERTASFNAFLINLHRTRTAVGEAYYGEQSRPETKGLRAAQAFVDLGEHAILAARYMSDAGKPEFQSLRDSLRAESTFKEGPAGRTLQINRLVERIGALIDMESRRRPPKLEGGGLDTNRWMQALKQRTGRFRSFLAGDRSQTGARERHL
jgi:hypothetical protein